MKVSAVIVGVNVAATLSVAMQTQACAEDGTAAFLKNSLSGVTTGKAHQPVGLSAMPAQSLSVQSAATARKVSLSDPRSVATRKALSSTVPAGVTGKGVKLRPFVAGRKLPSKFDRYEAQQPLEEQTATLDYSNESATLNGGVTEFTPYYVSSDSSVSPRGQYEMKQQQRRADSRRLRNAAKVASTFVRQAAPKMVPGAQASLPGQVGIPCADMNLQGGFERMMPADPRGSLIFGAQNPLVQQLQFGQQNPAPNQFAQQSFAPVHHQTPEQPLRAPNLTPQEQFEMNKLVEAACIQNGINPNQVQMPQQNENLYSRIGPPPFPLSLIPEDAMQNFLKGARSKRSNVMPSSPGVPHLGHATTTGAGIGASLPKAGFRSYARESMNVNAFRNYQRMPTSMPIKQHNVPQQHSRKMSVSNLPVSQMPVSNMPAQVESPRPMSYPPYKSNVNFGS